jgi:hypothetical protein
LEEQLPNQSATLSPAARTDFFPFFPFSFNFFVLVSLLFSSFLYQDHLLKSTLASHPFTALAFPKRVSRLNYYRI